MQRVRLFNLLADVLAVAPTFVATVTVLRKLGFIESQSFLQEWSRPLRLLL